MSDRLATKDMGRKVELLALSVGQLGPHLTQCRLGRGLPSRLTKIDLDRKVGAAVPLSGGEGTRSPLNTMWPEPRPNSVPSGILIHPAVWPQYTNVTDRQDRTDN